MQPIEEEHQVQEDKVEEDQPQVDEIEKNQEIGEKKKQTSEKKVNSKLRYYFFHFLPHQID